MGNCKKHNKPKLNCTYKHYYQVSIICYSKMEVSRNRIFDYSLFLQLLIADYPAKSNY